MFDEKLKVAYEKAEEFLQHFNHNNCIISTQDIISSVEQHYCADVDISFTSFKKANIDKPYGAMMKIELDSNEGAPQKASIILNVDNDNKFQKFSLLHEIGHLVMHAWDQNEIFKEKNKQAYVVSTHIDYKITNISKSEYESDRYLLNEQIANVFALRVLMPTKLFYTKIRDCHDLDEVAAFFGVAKEAVISRAMIGA